MSLADNYKWEAQTGTGEIITKGGDLSACSRFSLIPQVEGLPRVDVCGVQLVRRFGRGFAKAHIGSTKLPCKLRWVLHSNRIALPEELQGVIRKGDLLKRAGATFKWYQVLEVTDREIILHKSYDEGKRSKDAETIHCRPSLVQKDEYLHCVVCKGFRMYVNSRTGQVITTPEDYELDL